MSIDWNWGIFLNKPRSRQHHLSWLDLEWISGDDRFVDLLDYRLPRRFIFRHFTYRSKPFSLVWVRCMSNCSQRAVDCAILYPVSGDPRSCCRRNGMWFKAELIPIFSFSFHPCSAWGCLPPPVFANRYAPRSCRCREGKNAALAMGLTLPQAYRYVLLPNAYRVIVPPMTSEMMNLVKNSAIASTIGLVDMAAQAGKLLDYSAHAWESFTAITLAYVLGLTLLSCW